MKMPAVVGDDSPAGEQFVQVLADAAPLGVLDPDFFVIGRIHQPAGDQLLQRAWLLREQIEQALLALVELGTKRGQRPQAGSGQGRGCGRLRRLRTCHTRL